MDENILNIGEDAIPLKKDISYLYTHLQSKDQIYFYWIPVEMIKEGKIVATHEGRQV